MTKVKASLKDSTTCSEEPKKKRIDVNKKGKSFERYLANSIGHIFPNAERMLEYQAGNNKGTDLQNTWNFKFQCKAYANYAPLSKLKEVSILDDSDIPVLVTKGNRLAPIACLYLSDFIELVERAAGLKDKIPLEEVSTTEVKRHKAKQDDTVGVILDDEDTDRVFYGMKVVVSSSLVGNETVVLFSNGTKRLVQFSEDYSTYVDVIGDQEGSMNTKAVAVQFSKEAFSLLESMVFQDQDLKPTATGFNSLF